MTTTINRIKRFGWLLGLFIFATFGSIIGGVFINPACYVLCFVFPKNKYIGNIARASDRLNAAYLGWSGRHMVSTELVYADTMLWKILRNGLDTHIEKDHCAESAYEERAYCPFPKPVNSDVLGKRI